MRYLPRGGESYLNLIGDISSILYDRNCVLLQPEYGILSLDWVNSEISIV